MVNCEFLYHEIKKTCKGCRGWFCTSTSRNKKLSDTSICTDEEKWPECPRYLSVYPKQVEESEDALTETVDLPPTEEVVSTQTIGETITVAVEPTPPVAPPPTDCPYLGPIPEGRYGCCGYWCYAYDEPLRSSKRCMSRPSWRECRRKFKAERAGVKYAMGGD